MCSFQLALKRLRDVIAVTQGGSKSMENRECDDRQMVFKKHSVPRLYHVRACSSVGSENFDDLGGQVQNLNFLPHEARHNTLSDKAVLIILFAK